MLIVHLDLKVMEVEKKATVVRIIIIMTVIVTSCQTLAFFIVMDITNITIIVNTLVVKDVRFGPHNPSLHRLVPF